MDQLDQDTVNAREIFSNYPDAGGGGVICSTNFIPQPKNCLGCGLATAMLKSLNSWNILMKVSNNT